MPRDPLLQVNAGARDLPAARPSARKAGIALRGDVEDAERFDQCLLEGAQVPMEVLLIGGDTEVDNRIADELTGSVESHVAAALDFEDIDAGGSEEMSRMGIPAQRYDRWVLEQQEHIMIEAPRDSVFSELPLPVECI